MPAAVPPSPSGAGLPPDAPPASAPADDERPSTPAGEPATLPDRFADGTMRQLEPGIRTIWMLKLGTFFLLVAGAVFFYEVVGWMGGGPDGPGFWLTGAALVVGLVVSIGLPRLRYRYWRYALRPEELYLERGVFNRVRTVVPLRRIQHLDVSQDLFEREFDLGKLVVHTAGGRSSDVAVPGLAYETAERLRDDVKHYVLDDAV